jgi:hypothetical protein
MAFRVEATDYNSLQAAFRSRADDLGATRLELDALCATSDGYMGKFLGLRQVRKAHLGTLGKVLRGLGLKLIVVEDETANLPHIKPRDETRVRHRETSQMPAA